MNPSLSKVRLLETLKYDHMTGLFSLRKSRGNLKAGAIAGCINHEGYRQIKIDRRTYRAARLAWFYMHSEWPESIDHINRQRSDDRICNLRPATTSQQGQNMLFSRSKLPKGVYRNSRNSFMARICVNGKRLYLGSFSDAVPAGHAYADAAQRYFGAFARN